MIIQVLTTDMDGDGDKDAADAAIWHDSTDHDGDGDIDPLIVPVIADTDGQLYDRYLPDCTGGGFLCVLTCHGVPQVQFIDRGMVTVIDTCRVEEGGNTCPANACAYDDVAVRQHLDALLPPGWCGTAQP